MLLFAHTGITLGAGILLDRSLIGSDPFSAKNNSRSSPRVLSMRDFSPGNRTSRLHLLKNHPDYRLLLIGSLLPDLIDKPIGDIFFYQTFRNGRIFGHTLCFTVCLAVLGACVYKRWKKLWFLILSFGSAMHLILDQMWLNPRTLLWPAYGWSFARVDSTDFFGWLPDMFHALMTNTSVFVSELIGFSILAWFAARLIQKRQVYAFITRGTAT